MPESQQSVKGTQMILNRIALTPGKVILDTGCGEGKWGKLLKNKGCSRIDGIEVWKPYIEKYKLANYYDNLFNMDMRNFEFSGKDYNIVILGDVLEHITYEEALAFLEVLKSNIETIFLTLPVTYCRQGAAQGNPHEEHHYQWSDKEIRALGFKLLNVSVNNNGLVAVGCYEWNR